MQLYNSLTRKVEEFVPQDPNEVKVYTCGPTVYDYAHIGHGRKYVGDDIIKRTLTMFGFNINHVQNVTDVGHLTSDADEGEDKLEKGAKKSGKTVWDVAKFFTEQFYDSMDKLNILRPTHIAKATEHIPEQIELVRKLVEKGYAYDTPEAVYYDISKFKNYGELFGQSLEEKLVAVRDEVQTGSHKKNPLDFALWFKRVGRFSDHVMHWDSPWGDGFPGWHIECSAMSMKYLGEQLDIHTGGIDHLSIHHPNEIAQSEAATGKSPFVKYWVHHAFLLVDDQKMSKSLGNFYTISDIEKKGFSPIALRYFFLTAHYRKSQNFTWEALESAQKALNNLYDYVANFKTQGRNRLSEEKLDKVDAFQVKFKEALANDLNVPQALAVLWEVAKSNIPNPDKLDLFYSFDEVLGLKFREVKVKQKYEYETVNGGTVISDSELSADIVAQIEARNQAKVRRDFSTADELRDKLAKEGYTINDTPSATVITVQDE